MEGRARLKGGEIRGWEVKGREEGEEGPEEGEGGTEGGREKEENFACEKPTPRRETRGGMEAYPVSTPSEWV